MIDTPPDVERMGQTDEPVENADRDKAFLRISRDAYSAAPN